VTAAQTYPVPLHHLHFIVLTHAGGVNWHDASDRPRFGSERRSMCPAEDPATVYVAIAAARHTQPNLGQEVRVIIAAVAARIRAPRLT
jgi:hypothetical protein